MKTQLPTALCSFLLLAFLIPNLQAQIYINEFMASNSSSISDESGAYEDWIEIYNAGSTGVDLAGYYITDNLADPLLWQIPDDDANLSTVPAGGYLILWADKDIADGVNHVNIKLGAGGEDIVLTEPDGATIVDQYTFAAQVENVSFGRVGDGQSEWDFFAQPTPGTANDTPPGAPQVFAPVASITGGIYSGTVSVSWSTATDGATIYYTLDGSHPTENDEEYSGAISIDENTPLRARAYLAPFLPSPIQTETYLFDVNHSFPVIAYTADPDELFDSDSGMYINVDEDIEINVNVEMYELDGTQGFNQILESEINGSGSKDQKSLALKAKSSLGNNTIDHRIFPLSERDKYRSLILRNSGQDWNKSFFRDAVGTSLSWDVSDINGAQPTIVKPKIHGQAYRPSITYINGEYWGIYNIRERTDKRYIKVHFGLDDNEIDFIENHDEAKEGDFVAFNELEEFLEDNNLDSESNFQFVENRVDLDDYIDYISHNIYLDNSDWPGNNHRQFRERAADGKWRFLIYDLDFTFGLSVEGQSWNSGYNDANSLDRLLSENNSWPNPSSATLLFRRLMENESWRTQFINRMADQLNLLYEDDRVLDRINQFQAAYAPEVQGHFDRWQSGYNNWDENVDILRDFANGRADNVRNHFISEINEINGTSNITVNLNNDSEGDVNISTISVHAGNAPFSGIYFEGVDIPVRAYPTRGNILESWSGDLSGDDPNEFININSNTNITANFGQGSTADDPIVINEINYNSLDANSSDDWVELFNPNSEAVDISGWYFEDETDAFFGIPANTILPAGGYLLLVETAAKFSNIYPQVNNFIGDFGIPVRGFGLSNKGELITLKNAAGVLIDEVEYDDKAPWPVEADGNGPTLQLIDPGLDNALASSWQAIPATPGNLNGTSTSQNQSINFAAISDQLNTNPPFQISATATSGLPVNFSILSGPASISGNTISLNGGTGVVTVRASQDGNVDWNPALPVSQSFMVSDDAPPPPPPTGEYCESESNAPWHEWIASVILNNLNNSSPKDAYSDFTNLSANLTQGENYDITLTAGFSYTTYDEYFRVWIDYDQNGEFDSPVEIAFSGIVSGTPNGTETGAVMGTVNVPADALTGGTRMRVSMQRGAYPPECGNIIEGEVEDYGINISMGSGSSIVLNNCPVDINETADPGQNSMTINWAAPTASSTCLPNSITVDQIAGPDIGSTFMIGTTTTITYVLSDECGNQATCTFDITVNPPDNGSIILSCPSDLIVQAEAGQSDALATWDSPTAFSTCPTGGLVVNQDGGESSGTFFSIGTHEISYIANDACGNSESCSFEVTILPSNPGGEDPCASSSDFPWHEWIANVQLNTINNPSAKSDYSDFTDISTSLTPSILYPITLVTGYSWETFEEHWKVWIDYNQNGIFEEPSEIAFSDITHPPPNSTASATINGMITVPSNALDGATVMRVAMKQGAAPGPCEILPFGEVEDYTVIINQSINEDRLHAFNRDIKLFPNPVRTELTLRMTEYGVRQMEIYNIAGQRVESQMGIENEIEYRINVNNWPKGMYFIHLHLEGGVQISRRFIVIEK